MSQEQPKARRVPLKPSLQLGDAIRERREARSLSIQAAASQAQISQAYQFKLESGIVRSPSPRILHRLGRVLDLPYAELMRLAGYAFDGEPSIATSSGSRSTKAGNRPAEAAQDVNTGPAPTNRMVIRLLEEIRRDVAAVREDLRRLEAMQQAQTAVHPSPPRD
jgi:transcriptional regulator with XRE-family HTH domain